MGPSRHGATAALDRALEGDDRGIWALKVSLVGLGLTAGVQLVVVLLSGSIALLADTLHNATDAAIALPIWLAFTLGRRAATRRFGFGFGRAEDLAGLVVVVFIAGSAVLSAYEAIVRLLHPAEVHLLGVVAAAGLAGLAGNEIVARFQIKVGREIGSAALVANGLHARADGIASLGVVAGAVGVTLGFRDADPVAGLLIACMIALVLRDAARDVLLRMMDAVDPGILDQCEGVLRGVPGIKGLGQVRLRWIGHRLHAEAEVIVDSSLSVVAAHDIAEGARHALLHSVPHLSSAILHTDPWGPGGLDTHAPLAHDDPDKDAAGGSRGSQGKVS